MEGSGTGRGAAPACPPNLHESNTANVQLTQGIPWARRDAPREASTGDDAAPPGSEETARAGISVADVTAGTYVYSGILTAPLTRTTTGAVQAVEVSLFEAPAECRDQPGHAPADIERLRTSSACGPTGSFDHDPGQLAPPWPALPIGPTVTAEPEPSVTGRLPAPGQSRVTDFVSPGGVTTRPVTRTPEPPESLSG